jgi:MacB-like periplasmic core domain
MSTFFEIALHAAAVHAEILQQALGYTARMLGRSPGFALAAILVLALGVGANTAAFSLTDHVLIRSLPFRDAGRLVKLWEDVPGYNRMELSPPNYRDSQRMSTSFEGMAAFTSLPTNFIGEGQPERVERAAVTIDLFRLLGAQPLLGRLFTPLDGQESAPATVLLSHQFWQTRFGGDAGVLGRTVRLDGVSFTVTGVMPPAFYFPNRDTQLWIPLRGLAQDPDRTNNYLQVLAKLKPRASLTAARAEMRLITAQLERAYPKENLGTSAAVIDLRDEVSEQSRMPLVALSGRGNLRAADRLRQSGEPSARPSPCPAERIGREDRSRSLPGTAGASIADREPRPNGAWRHAWLAAGHFGSSVDRAARRECPETPSIDFRVLSVAALLTALAGPGFGLIPAWRVCRRADLTGLSESSRSGGGRKERLRSALVIAEVAVTVILLVSSGLFLRALWRLHAVDPGFRAEGYSHCRLPCRSRSMSRPIRVPPSTRESSLKFDLCRRCRMPLTSVSCP